MTPYLALWKLNYRSMSVDQLLTVKIPIGLSPTARDEHLAYIANELRIKGLYAHTPTTTQTVTVDGVAMPMPIDPARQPMFVGDGGPNPDFDWEWWRLSALTPADGGTGISALGKTDRETP